MSAYSIDKLSRVKMLKLLQTSLQTQTEAIGDVVGPIEVYLRSMNLLLDEVKLEKIDNQGSLSTALLLAQREPTRFKISFKSAKSLIDRFYSASGRDSGQKGNYDEESDDTDVVIDSTVQPGIEGYTNEQFENDGIDRFVTKNSDTIQLHHHVPGNKKVIIPGSGSIEIVLSNGRVTIRKVLPFMVPRNPDDSGMVSFEIPFLDSKHLLSYRSSRFPVSFLKIRANLRLERVELKSVSIVSEFGRGLDERLPFSELEMASQGGFNDSRNKIFGSVNRNTLGTTASHCHYPYAHGKLRKYCARNNPEIRGDELEGEVLMNYHKHGQKKQRKKYRNHNGNEDERKYGNGNDDDDDDDEYSGYGYSKIKNSYGSESQYNEQQIPIGQLTRTFAGIALKRLLKKQFPGEYRVLKNDRLFITKRILKRGDPVGDSLEALYQSQQGLPGPTIMELLTDTAGLPRSFHMHAEHIPKYLNEGVFLQAKGTALSRFIDDLANGQVIDPPGSTVRPSDIGWAVIGYLIASLSGNSTAAIPIISVAKDMGIKSANFPSSSEDANLSVDQIYQASSGMTIYPNDLGVLTDHLSSEKYMGLDSGEIAKGMASMIKPRYKHPDFVDVQTGMAGWKSYYIETQVQGLNKVPILENTSFDPKQSQQINVSYAPTLGITVCTIGKHLEMKDFHNMARENLLKVIKEYASKNPSLAVTAPFKDKPFPPRYYKSRETPEYSENIASSLKKQSDILAEMSKMRAQTIRKEGMMPGELIPDIAPVVGSHFIQRPRITVVAIKKKNKRGKEHNHVSSNPQPFKLILHGIVTPGNNFGTIGQEEVRIYPDPSTGFYRTDVKDGGNPVSVFRFDDNSCDYDDGKNERNDTNTVFIISVGNCAYASKPWLFSNLQLIANSIKQMTDRSRVPKFISDDNLGEEAKIRQRINILRFLAQPEYFSERAQNDTANYIETGEGVTKKIGAPTSEPKKIGSLICGWGSHWVPLVGCVRDAYAAPVPYYYGGPSYLGYGGPALGINVGFGRRGRYGWGGRRRW